VINQVPAVAGPKTFEAFVCIYSHPRIVSTLIPEVQLSNKEAPIQMDNSPNNRFTFQVASQWCMSHEPPGSLLYEYDIKVID